MNNFVKGMSWLFVFVVFFALLSLACGESASPTLVATVSPPTPAEEQGADDVSTEPPSALTSYQIGDIVSIGDSVLVVLGWREIEASQFLAADEGKKFVSVDAIVINQSNSEKSISSMLQMTLRDETAQRYNPDLSAIVASGVASIDGPLRPGERIRGQVGFQVPEDVQGLQFVFDASLFGGQRVVVDLGDEPILMPPPDEILGETEQEVFAINETIQIGSMLLVVNDVAYPAGDQFNRPSEGNKFLVVDLTLENSGNTTASVSTLLQMWVKDPTGQQYQVDLSATVASGGTTPDGELVPGERIRGQVGFQVPMDMEELVFVFNAEVFGAGTVFVALPEN
jgi:hypothetical protein